MSLKTLEQIGLSEEQAKVYSCLISKGTLSARKISLETGITRSLIYKIIKQLIDLELVSEYEHGGKISKFNALPPVNLKKLVDKQKEATALADNALDEAVSTLGAQFNLTCGKPSVRFYEGIEGIKVLYKDILRTKKDIKLIRSVLDDATDERLRIIHEQIKNQVELGIHARIISSKEYDVDDIDPETDKENLVTRCIVPKEEFTNPAQAIIYGNKVTFTSFTDCMITTIIEDPSIQKTMSMLFDSLWEKYSNKK